MSYSENLPKERVKRYEEDVKKISKRPMMSVDKTFNDELWSQQWYLVSYICSSRYFHKLESYPFRTVTRIISPEKVMAKHFFSILQPIFIKRF